MRCVQSKWGGLNRSECQRQTKRIAERNSAKAQIRKGLRTLAGAIAALLGESWVSGAPPPPTSFCKFAQARQRRRNSSLFQRGLARPTEPQRLTKRRFSVSERLSSLTERTSPELVRSKKTQHFQSFADSCRPNFLPRFSRPAFKQRHPRWAL